jgi:hypothetical protein
MKLHFLSQSPPICKSTSCKSMFCLSVTHKQGLAHNGNKPVNLQTKNKVSLNISLIHFLTIFFFQCTLCTYILMYISIHVTSSQCIYALFKQKQKKMTFAAAGKKEKKNTPLTLWITQMPKNRLVNDALFVCVSNYE